MTAGSPMYEAMRASRDGLLAENQRLRERLDALHEELTAFAEYSRSVAADAAGPARLTWQERAEWADRLAEHAYVV